MATESELLHPIHRRRSWHVYLIMAAGAMSLLVYGYLLDYGCIAPWEITNNLIEARKDKALLDTQGLHKACSEYVIRERSLPPSLEVLKQSAERHGTPLYEGWLLDPWGKEYQLEVRKNPTTGEDEPVVWTIDPEGRRIQWPR